MEMEPFQFRLIRLLAITGALCVLLAIISRPIRNLDPDRQQTMLVAAGVIVWSMAAGLGLKVCLRFRSKRLAGRCIVIAPIADISGEKMRARTILHLCSWLLLSLFYAVLACISLKEANLKGVGLMKVFTALFCGSIAGSNLFTVWSSRLAYSFELCRRGVISGATCSCPWSKVTIDDRDGRSYVRVSQGLCHSVISEEEFRQVKMEMDFSNTCPGPARS